MERQLSNNKKAFIAVTQNVPTTRTTMQCTRFTLNGQSITNKEVQTSEVIFVACIGRHIYDVETQNSRYLVYVDNDDAWNIQDSTYIGFSGLAPLQGCRFLCTRIVETHGATFVLEDILTSKVETISVLGNGIRKIQTRNSTYYVLCPEFN